MQLLKCYTRILSLHVVFALSDVVTGHVSVRHLAFDVQAAMRGWSSKCWLERLIRQHHQMHDTRQRRYIVAHVPWRYHEPVRAEQVRHDGSGGIPSGAALVPENADTWAAPAPIGMSQNDGHHLGQIVGVPAEQVLSIALSAAKLAL